MPRVVPPEGVGGGCLREGGRDDVQIIVADVGDGRAVWVDPSGRGHLLAERVKVLRPSDAGGGGKKMRVWKAVNKGTEQRTERERKTRLVSARLWQAPQGKNRKQIASPDTREHDVTCLAPYVHSRCTRPRQASGSRRVSHTGTAVAARGTRRGAGVPWRLSQEVAVHRTAPGR